MHAEIFKFQEYAGSGRALVGALRFFDNTLTLLEHIASISYKVVKLSDGTVVTGIVPLNAMKSAPVPWRRDSYGYTFLWNAPGWLWPTAGERYRIIVTWITVPTYTPAPSAPFIKVWEVTTLDPDT